MRNNRSRISGILWHCLKLMGQFHIPFSMYSWEVLTCSHTLTVMKLIAKWTIYKLTKISETKACTSKTSYCLLPQSRRKLFKSAIFETFLISPASKK